MNFFFKTKKMRRYAIKVPLPDYKLEKKPTTTRITKLCNQVDENLYIIIMVTFKNLE